MLLERRRRGGGGGLGLLLVVGEVLRSGCGYRVEMPYLGREVVVVQVVRGLCVGKYIHSIVPIWGFLYEYSPRGASSY